MIDVLGVFLNAVNSVVGVCRGTWHDISAQRICPSSSQSTRISEVDIVGLKSVVHVHPYIVMICAPYPYISYWKSDDESIVWYGDWNISVEIIISDHSIVKIVNVGGKPDSYKGALNSSISGVYGPICAYVGYCQLLDTSQTSL